jgi:hypothetical protein
MKTENIRREYIFYIGTISEFTYLFILHILLQIKQNLLNVTTLQNITLQIIKLFPLIFHRNVLKTYTSTIYVYINEIY